MSSLVFSPHTDDAIFSICDYMVKGNNFTIASAFAGVPTDDYGYNKHTTLRKEHEEACNIINAKIINNDLLDDVYGKQDEQLLILWIKSIINNYDNIYIPLGIHHPDHVFLSDTLISLMKDFNKKYFVYAELPYRILYPELFNERLKKFKQNNILKEIKVDSTFKKIEAVRKYKSQIDDELMLKLFVQEMLWELIND